MRHCLALLLAWLCLLLMGCQPLPISTPPDVSQDAIPYVLDAGHKTKADVRSLLVLAVDYDGEGNSHLSSVLLAVYNRTTGASAILGIPSATRVWIGQYVDGVNTAQKLGQLGDAYHAAESEGMGEVNVLTAVSRLMGGVTIDDYLVLNSAQLDLLAQKIGDIHVDVNEDMSAYGIDYGLQNVSPFIGAYAQYSVLNEPSDWSGARIDQNKILRHMQLLRTILITINQQLAALENSAVLPYLDELIQGIRTSLDAQNLALVVTCIADTQVASQSLLQGQLIDEGPTHYWLVDREFVKDWVLRWFYP